jgi:hypothetical protein
LFFCHTYVSLTNPTEGSALGFKKIALGFLVLKSIFLNPV